MASDRRYLDWIRSLPCAASGIGCGGGVTAHHVRRLGERKQDRRAVPLCCAHHLATWSRESVHGMGKRAFEQKHGIGFEDLIVRLNEAWRKLNAKTAA